ncbi:MAG: hypothetical protein KFH87_00200 [Bacteroidetes bacterium]|nr:hypothetical protein [Bacteroidota bacterium]
MRTSILLVVIFSFMPLYGQQSGKTATIRTDLLESDHGIIFVLKLYDCIGCNLSVPGLSKHCHTNHPRIRQYVCVVDGSQDDAAVLAERLEMEVQPISLEDLGIGSDFRTPALIYFNGNMVSTIFLMDSRVTPQRIDSLIELSGYNDRNVTCDSTITVHFDSAFSVPRLSRIDYNHEMGLFAITDAFYRKVFLVGDNGSLKGFVSINDSLIALHCGLELASKMLIRNMQKVHPARIMQNGDIGILYSHPVVEEDPDVEKRLLVGTISVFVRYSTSGEILFTRLIETEDLRPPLVLDQWFFSGCDNAIIIPLFPLIPDSSRYKREMPSIAFSLDSGLSTVAPYKRGRLTHHFGLDDGTFLYDTYHAQSDSLTVAVEAFDNLLHYWYGPAASPRYSSTTEMDGDFSRKSLLLTSTQSRSASNISIDSVITLLDPVVNGIDIFGNTLLISYSIETPSDRPVLSKVMFVDTSSMTSIFSSELHLPDSRYPSHVFFRGSAANIVTISKSKSAIYFDFFTVRFP